MHTTAVQEKKSGSVKSGRTMAVDAKLVPFEVFLKKYSTREDGYKYEWVAGVVEKTKRTMDRKQNYILWNLLDCFDFFRLEGKATGRLMPEVELYFNSSVRRPDIAWFTREQIENLANDAARDVPAFIIEIISSRDQVNLLKQKMANYRDAGVQVVWHILPALKQVDVYTGPNLNYMTTFVGDEICTAAPVLPDFAISVNDIFKKTQPA